MENTEWITQAARLGGAIYDNGSSNFIVNQGRFQSNQASQQGGAVYFTQTQSPLIGNAVFIHNAAPRGASVMADTVVDLTLAGVSLAGNIPETGANLEAIGAGMTVVNSILWGNITETSAFDVGSIDVSWSIAPAEVEKVASKVAVVRVEVEMAAETVVSTIQVQQRTHLHIQMRNPFNGTQRNEEFSIR